MPPEETVSVFAEVIGVDRNSIGRGGGNGGTKSILELHKLMSWLWLWVYVREAVAPRQSH